MLTLAFESSAKAASVALCEDERLISQVIQCSGAVRQLVGYVRDSVVHPVLHQHDIVAFPQEYGCEAAVVLPLARHIESAVYVDEDGILPNLRGGIIDIHHLLACPVLNVRDGESLLQRIGISWFGRYLVGSGHKHLQHRPCHLETAAGDSDKDCK